MNTGCVLVPQLPLVSGEAICNRSTVRSGPGCNIGDAVMSPKPIFFDPSGRRGRIVSALVWVSGTISLFTLAAFVLTLATIDSPPQKGSPSTTPQPSASTTASTNSVSDPQL